MGEANISNCTMNQTGVTTIETSGTYWVNETMINTTHTRCITVESNNVLLDCRGNRINSSGTQAIRIEGNNVTIRNCSIIGTTTGSAISLVGGSERQIINNTVTGNGHGIGLEASTNNLIENNSILNSQGMGILLASAGGAGSDNNRIINNNITNCGYLFNAFDGLIINNCSFNNVSNNFIKNNANNGIQLFTGANNNIIDNNVISDHPDNGIFILNYSNNNIIRDNIIIGNGDAATEAGININSSSANNLSFNVINHSNFTGIRLFSAANTIMLGNNVSNSLWWDLTLFASEGGRFNNNTVNYDNINFETTFSFKKYSGDVNISGMSTAPSQNPRRNIDKFLNISGTNWVVMNISYLAADVTNNDVLPSTISLYHYNGSAWVAVFGATLTNSLVSGNLTTFSPFALLGAANCSDLFNDTILLGNILAHGTCFSINTSNITLDCNGSRITGNKSGYGVESLDKLNITIKNCLIYNFTAGIFVHNTSNSSFYNISAINNTEGFRLEANASFNNLTNNTANLNTNLGQGSGIILDEADNNTFERIIANFNDEGFELWAASSENIFVNCTAFNNSWFGIDIVDGSSLDNSFSLFNLSQTHLKQSWDIHCDSANNSFYNITIGNNKTGYDTKISTKAYNGTFRLTGLHRFPANPANRLNISNYVNVSKAAGTWIIFNFTYSDADIASIQENTLNIYRYNGTWNQLTSTVVAASNIVSANLTQFSAFAPFGQEPAPPPPAAQGGGGGGGSSTWYAYAKKEICECILANGSLYPNNCEKPLLTSLETCEMPHTVNDMDKFVDVFEEKFDSAEQAKKTDEDSIPSAGKAFFSKDIKASKKGIFGLILIIALAALAIILTKGKKATPKVKYEEVWTPSVKSKLAELKGPAKKKIKPLWKPWKKKEYQPWNPSKKK